MDLNAYIREEVKRQGYIVHTDEYVEMCMGMARAWMQAETWYNTDGPLVSPSVEDVLTLGKLVHPRENLNGFRRKDIRIRGAHTPFAPNEEIPRLMDGWCQACVDGLLTPEELYVAFEEIHPFGDGNGRTGKVLFNWLNETLDAPVWPKGKPEWRVP